jgi:hypothetical protein
VKEGPIFLGQCKIKKRGNSNANGSNFGKRNSKIKKRSR